MNWVAVVAGAAVGAVGAAIGTVIVRRELGERSRRRYAEREAKWEEQHEQAALEAGLLPMPMSEPAEESWVTRVVRRQELRKAGVVIDEQPRMTAFEFQRLLGQQRTHADKLRAMMAAYGGTAQAKSPPPQAQAQRFAELNQLAVANGKTLDALARRIGINP